MGDRPSEGEREPKELDMQLVMERLRKDTNGPSDRAARILNHLRAAGKFNNWDVLCFCVEYIGSQVGVMPWLEDAARSLVRLVYMAHYVRFEKTRQWQEKQILGQDVKSDSSKGKK